MPSDEVADTNPRRRYAVLAAAVVLTVLTKMLLPEPSGTEFTSWWFTLGVDIVSAIILVAGYDLAITHLLSRGDASV